MDKYSAEIRNLIKHENELISHRLGWLMATQSLLYVALAFFWSQGFEGVIIIALVGIFSCLSFGFALSFADKAIKQIRGKYTKELSKKGKDEEDYPPVIGYEGASYPFLLPWNFLPWLHAIAWATLVVLHFYGECAMNPPAD